MLQRCRDPQYPNWVSVSICERWRLPDGVGFKNFLADLGERPVDEPATSRTRTGKIIYQTLGRYRDQGDYEPGNCEWMTQERQAHHQGPRSAPGGQPSSSRFKGVHRDKNSWRAAIRVTASTGISAASSAKTMPPAPTMPPRGKPREDCHLNFPSARRKVHSHDHHRHDRVTAPGPDGRFLPTARRWHRGRPTGPGTTGCAGPAARPPPGLRRLRPASRSLEHHPRGERREPRGLPAPLRHRPLGLRSHPILAYLLRRGEHVPRPRS